MTTAADGEPQEQDLVLVLLRRVVALVPALDRAVVAQIEAEMRALYGGHRIRIPKRGRHLTPAERGALFQDGLSTMPTEEILQKHRISRRTLERQMKRGGRFGGG